MGVHMERVEARRGIGTIAPVLVCGALVCTLLASGAILTSTRVNADTDTTVTTTSITVAATCSLESTLDTAHTATIPNGVYSGGSDYYPDGIGQTTLKAFCNDAEGFSIYAVGYSEEVIGNTYLKDSNLDVSTNIVTGTATSGDISNWAMKIGAVSGTYTPIVAGSTEDTEKASGDPDFSNYTSIPSKYTRVAYKNSGTDVGPASTGSRVTTTYAAYVSRTQPAGTYEGKVKYTLVHPASEEPLSPQTTETGKICYYANNSKAVGTMGCQDVTASPTLLASNFSLDGYGFAGWSDQYDYSTNQNAHFYGPQETITINTADYTGDNNGLSLYAVWVKSKGDLQNWTGCSSLTKANEATNIFSQSITALSDQRDDNTYAVAKLADGNCWMIENLRLESTNSDNSTGTLAQGYGKYSGTGTNYGNFAGLADAESTGFSSTYSANSLYSNDGSNDTINIGTSDYPAYRMPRYNNYNNQSTSAGRPQNPTSNSATNSTTNAGMYSYGNYYTWAAAMANTNYYNTTTADANGFTPSEAAKTSLCPTGWTLPYGRNTGNGAASKGFSYLDTQLGGTGATSSSSTDPTGATMSLRWRSFPNNFLYSGYFYTSSAFLRGSDGFYWSSTAFNYNNSYNLYLYSSNVYPGTNNFNKFSGFSIRCLAGS